MRGCLTFLLCLLLAQGYSQDRQLSYFIDKAIEGSPLLGDLRNQVQVNRLDSLLIVAAQRPQVAFASNDNYAPIINGYGYDKAITNGANISGLFSINKSFLTGKTNRIQFESIRLLVEAAKNNLLITEQDIRKSVINQYLVTYGDQLQLKFNNAIQDRLNREEQVLKKLAQLNVYKQVDYLSFFVTVQQNDFKRKQQYIQYKDDYASLNYLCGIYDTTLVPLDSPRINLEQLPVVSNSVFFRKYNIDSLTLQNSRLLLNKNYVPRLNAYADAGYYSSMDYLPYKNFGTSVGLTLVVPIFDGKQKQLQLEKIDLQEKSRQRNRAYFSNQYQQQITQLNNQLKSIRELTADINMQLKYIETLMSVNQQLLQTGDVKIYDYILALNNYLNARSIINENNIKQWMLINQINYFNR